MFGREAKNWIISGDISKFNQAVKVQNSVLYPVPSVYKSLGKTCPDTEGRKSKREKR
jgi:hypothetical protein